MKEVMKNTLYVLVAVLFVIALCSIESAIVMWLWNNVIASLFDITQINFGFACKIMFAINLVCFLFGNRD